MQKSNMREVASESFQLEGSSVAMLRGGGQLPACKDQKETHVTRKCGGKVIISRD